AAVEWFERLLPAAGEDLLLVTLRHGGGDRRLIRLEAHGPRHERLLRAALGVVSAMAGETNRLLALARQAAPAPDPRETDALVATGEQVTAALTALALPAAGVPARSFLGLQVPIVTTADHGRARILRIEEERLRRTLAAGTVAVVAG